MRGAVLLLLAAAASPASSTEPVLEPGEELETRVDADMDGDGTNDVAFVARTEEKRSLTIKLENSSIESLPLDTTPLGSGSLSFANGVLVFEDLTGGTTAWSTTRRYRFDAAGNRMRLIGLDATLYSRTYGRDGFELSWNLLTGRLVTRELRLNRKGGDAAYDPIVEKTTRRRSGKIWLSGTPDPEELSAAVRGR